MAARSSNGKAFVVLAGGMDPTTMSTEQVVEALAGTFKRPSYTPPLLPRVAMEVLRLSQAPITMDFSRDLEPVLSEDPLLTAQILRAANSPLMGARSPIRSIRQALTRLGLRGIRDVVMTVSLRTRVFRTPAYQSELDALFQHSQALGTIAQELARVTGGEQTFTYMCGLLADMGIAATLLVFGELPEGAPSLRSLWPAMLRVHEEAAMVVGREWELPEEVLEVIAHHHDLDPHHPQALLIANLTVAEGLSLRMGTHLGCHDPAWGPYLDAERLQRAQDYLGVDDAVLEQVMERCALQLNPPNAAA